MTTSTDSATASQRGQRRARRANLRYVEGDEKGYGRRRCGAGFTYLTTRGRTLRSQSARKRIKTLAIPPAWEDVWICSDARGHIQATGRDEAGRKQYIYHPGWQAVSTATKFDRMALFAALLPKIRKQVSRDLRKRGLQRERVLAAVVRLIDRGRLRVGSERYTQTNGSRGVTTLASDHVNAGAMKVSLDYPGKSNQRREVEIRDGAVARVIGQCEEIDSQFLFCYHDADGQIRNVESGDVNEYLRNAVAERITAKDFRTWWGSVIALRELRDRLAADDADERAAKSAVRDCVQATAEALGNTPAVCRSSYIHPALLAAAESGELIGLLQRKGKNGNKGPALSDDERQFADLLPRLSG